jgi:hypothetical protein
MGLKLDRHYTVHPTTTETLDRTQMGIALASFIPGLGERKSRLIPRQTKLWTGLRWEMGVITPSIPRQTKLWTETLD